MQDGGGGRRQAGGEPGVDADQPQEQQAAARIGPADRPALPPDAQGPLPLLQVEPGSQQEADQGRHHQPVHPGLAGARTRRGGRGRLQPAPVRQQDDRRQRRRHAQQQHDGVQRLEVLDAQNVAGGAGHHRQQDGERHREPADQRPQEIAGEGGHRDRHRHRLVDQQDAAVARRDPVEVGLQVGARPVALDQPAEQPEAQRVRQRESQEPLQPVQERHVDRVEETKPPQPAEGNGRRPYQGSAPHLS